VTSLRSIDRTTLGRVHGGIDLSVFTTMSPQEMGQLAGVTVGLGSLAFAGGKALLGKVFKKSGG
jgi:hypothetical protein